MNEAELIEKMANALSVAADFFNARDEMNAAVHTPSPMRLSPITIVVNEAVEAWRRYAFPIGYEGAVFDEIESGGGEMRTGE